MYFGNWFVVFLSILVIIFTIIGYFKFNRRDYERRLLSLGSISDSDSRERALKFLADFYKKPVEVVYKDLEEIRQRKR